MDFLKAIIKETVNEYENIDILRVLEFAGGLREILVFIFYLFYSKFAERELNQALYDEET